MQWLRILPANCAYKKENYEALLHFGYLWLHQLCILLKLKGKKKCNISRKENLTICLWIIFLVHEMPSFPLTEVFQADGVKSTRKNIGSCYLKITNFFLKGSW